jgi:hypothetical protein
VDLSPASQTRDDAEQRLAAHRHDRRTDSWHLGAGHQETSRMVAEQNGDDPYDLGEPPGGNDPDLQ